MAAILARNEANRFLRDTVESLKPLCDTILLLDDHSDDQTKTLAWDLGCEVRSREGEPMWGQESGARQELWKWGAEVAGDGWLYIADADHITVADPTVWESLLSSWEVNAWAFHLLDLWNEMTTFRVDGFWQGYMTPRPWLFKPSEVTGTWSTRGMHTGHAPHGDWKVGIAPESCYIKHAGWLKASDRQEKYDRYKAQFHQLSDHERAHVESILS